MGTLKLECHTRSSRIPWGFLLNLINSIGSARKDCTAGCTDGFQKPQSSNHAFFKVLGSPGMWKHCPTFQSKSQAILGTTSVVLPSH